MTTHVPGACACLPWHQPGAHIRAARFLYLQSILSSSAWHIYSGTSGDVALAGRRECGRDGISASPCHSAIRAHAHMRRVCRHLHIVCTALSLASCAACTRPHSWRPVRLRSQHVCPELYVVPDRLRTVHYRNRRLLPTRRHIGSMHAASQPPLHSCKLPTTYQ